ncbi:MAG: hypothetical protein JWM51_2277 [Microbacteriaceae bacterium]|nr:hypothetical protein [Microbacteriaceae bacterium]
MRNPFARKPQSGDYPKGDAGAGSFDDYAFDLIPKNKQVVVVLAGSEPFRDEIARVESAGSEELQVFIAKRTVEEERTDAAMPVRFFIDSRMTGIVGFVPRGLEPVMLVALGRLEPAGRPSRIPAEIRRTKTGLRVALLMGKTR